jgi:transcriptional regulator with XRE-family HTH domain
VDQFALRLKELRRQAGLSQEGLAARTDLSQRTIARLESGEGSRPTRTTIRLLAQAFGMTPDEFMTNGGEGEAA